MGWLDPVDCMVAQDYLQAGNALEAGRLLLRSPQREHRAVRQLLLRVSQSLCEEATEAMCRDDILVAWEMIDCAAQCAALPPEAAALREKIAERRQELEQEQHWRYRRLDQARSWAADGHVRSAIGLLQRLGDLGEADRLRMDLEDQLARFERYVRQCHDDLERGDFRAAREQLDRARAINASDPQVAQLENALRQAQPPATSRAAPGQSCKMVDRRSLSIALGDHALVVLQHEVVMGNLRGESIQIPIQARIHSRHTLLVRDRGRCLVVAYPDRTTLVNGDPVAVPRLLAHGDVIELGIPDCRWRFLLPVNGSSTAVLEPATPSCAWAQTPDGTRFRRVILLHEAADIRPQPPGHLILTELPCECLRLRWTASGLVAEAECGRLTIQCGDKTSTDTCPLVGVPGELTIVSDLSEAERLARAFRLRGREVGDQLVLRVRDPF